MWFDDLPADHSWARLWTGYVRCAGCAAIRTVDIACTVCGSAPIEPAHSTILVDGKEVKVLQALMGAEGRFEDWVYLWMLEREWKRPSFETERLSTIEMSKRPSQRAGLILIFWSYFETRLERLYREALRNLPVQIADELLRRNGSIAARLERFYKTLFGSTYWFDLRDAGYSEISELLQQIHRSRNEFSHGKPEAITDALVVDLVAALKHEHESWIAVFNRRAASGALPRV